jgi:hypothetical protein
MKSLGLTFGTRVAPLFVGATLLIGCAQTPVAPIPAPTAAPDSSIVAPAPKVAAAPVIAPAAPAPAPTPAPAAVAAVPPVQPGLPGALPARPITRDPKSVATVAALTPDGATRYSCERGPASSATRSNIELPEGTSRICSRFPAMGPCQYERDACRASGGRVIRFDGVEITKEVELEYDRQVQRFRLNAG